MDHSYQIEENGLVLKPMNAGESEAYRQLRNRPENRAMLFTHDEITKEAQEAWFARYLTKSDDYMFSVLSAEGTFLGAVALYDATDAEAEFGRIIIDKEAACRGGVGTEALLLLCRIAKEQMHLTRIYLDLYEENIAAFKTYERAGFAVTKREPSAKEPDKMIVYMEKML